MSATGSTTIRSAAFVAVEAAIPQLARTNAAPKPRIPIQATVHRSRPVGAGLPASRRTSGESASEATTRRARASVAGGTSARTTRVAT